MTKKEILKKGADVADKITPLPLPTEKNKNKIKTGLRKFNNYMSEKFPDATEKLKTFDKKMDDFNENVDDYMKENFPKTRKVVSKVFKSKGGRVNLRGGGCAKRGIKKNAYGKNS